MESAALARFEPALDGSALVSAVVIHHEMHIQTRRDFLLDLMQELHELLATMARQATADDFTVDDIESREQRRGAMRL